MWLIFKLIAHATITYLILKYAMRLMEPNQENEVELIRDVECRILN